MQRLLDTSNEASGVVLAQLLRTCIELHVTGTSISSISRALKKVQITALCAVTEVGDAFKRMAYNDMHVWANRFDKLERRARVSEDQVCEGVTPFRGDGA